MKISKFEAKRLYMYWVNANAVVSKHIHDGIEPTQRNLDNLSNKHYEVENLMFEIGEYSRAEKDNNEDN